MLKTEKSDGFISLMKQWQETDHFAWKTTLTLNTVAEFFNHKTWKQMVTTE